MFGIGWGFRSQDGAALGMGIQAPYLGPGYPARDPVNLDPAPAFFIAFGQTGYGPGPQKGYHPG